MSCLYSAVGERIMPLEGRSSFLYSAVGGGGGGEGVLITCMNVFVSP